KPGAQEFIAAVCDAFYAVNQELEGDNSDEVLVALGAKFSKLELADMKTVVQQTQFYKTAAEGKALLNSDEFKTTMDTVKEFCESHDLVKGATIGFGSDAGEVNLKFDSSYLP
ncbi:MAG: hypothetical protein KDA87_11920, partial [Planctomycetales bacterium]|nr:hypothetical protein [Planctomycetales bacterium]